MAKPRRPENHDRPATFLRIPGRAVFVHLGDVAPSVAVRALLYALALTGCAAGDPGSSGPIAFAGPPQQTLASASGDLRVDVRWWPQPVHVGDGAVELAIAGTDGAPAAGASVSVLLWMPAHGHGASVQPKVTETAPGVFVAAPLYLHMPGEWELLMSMSMPTTTTGTVDDTATASLTVQ
jgi:hypothetical protein